MQQMFIVNNEYFLDIKNGRKTIEGRLNKPHYSHLYIGMPLLFKNKNTNETLVCTITSLNHYKTFSEMLEKEGIEHMLPAYSNRSLADGVALYESFPGYKEGVKEHGALAIGIALAP